MNFIYENAPTMSLLFFFGFFVWVAYRAYRPSAKRDMQAHANIPFEGENTHE